MQKVTAKVIADKDFETAGKWRARTEGIADSSEGQRDCNLRRSEAARKRGTVDGGAETGSKVYIFFEIENAFENEE
jgi:hypothetical protein